MRITKDAVRSLSADSVSLSAGLNLSVLNIFNGTQNDWDGPGYNFNTGLVDNIRGRNSTRHAAFLLFGAIHGWNRYMDDTLPFSVSQFYGTLGQPRTKAEWQHLYQGWVVAEGIYMHKAPSRTARPDILVMDDYYRIARPSEPNVTVRFMTATGTNPWRAAAGVEFYGRVVGTNPGERQLTVRPWQQRHAVPVRVSQVTHVY